MVYSISLYYSRVEKWLRLTSALLKWEGNE